MKQAQISEMHSALKAELEQCPGGEGKTHYM